jgi:hypothetical protein
MIRLEDQQQQPIEAVIFVGNKIKAIKFRTPDMVPKNPRKRRFFRTWVRR